MAEQIYDQWANVVEPKAVKEEEIPLVPEEVIPVEIVRPEWDGWDTGVWLVFNAAEGFLFGAGVMLLSQVVSIVPDLGYWESVALVVMARILVPVDTAAHLRWSRKLRWIDPKERAR